MEILVASVLKSIPGITRCFTSISLTVYACCVCIASVSIARGVDPPPKGAMHQSGPSNN